jgi:hypothetical protein
MKQRQLLPTRLLPFLRFYLSSSRKSAQCLSGSAMRRTERYSFAFLLLVPEAAPKSPKVPGRSQVRPGQGIGDAADAARLSLTGERANAKRAASFFFLRLDPSRLVVVMDAPNGTGAAFSPRSRAAGLVDGTGQRGRAAGPVDGARAAGLVGGTGRRTITVSEIGQDEGSP